MTDREREESYERYKQWQYNRIRYQNECFGYGLLIVVGFCFAIFHLKEIGIVVIIGGIIMLFQSLWRMYKKQKGLSKIEKMAISLGATVEKSENGSLAFSLPADTSTEILNEFEKIAAENGFGFSKTMNRKIIEDAAPELENIDNVDNRENRENREDVDNMPKSKPVKKKAKIKWAEPGSVNDNDQKNNGRTGEQGTDNLQYLYSMECLRCGAKYKVNGSNIYECRCPACQKGKAVEIE